MGWNADGTAKKFSIDFDYPPLGSETDNLNTLLATGDYPDLFATDFCSMSVNKLYEDGIILDLTDYIEKYMPNYKAWMDAHPEYVLTNEVDGEERYLQIFAVSDSPRDPRGGYVYRRDWVAKYGKNPETGEAFTWSWNDDKTEWTDDVVFPSGNEDPIYISDWEWMFEIFAEAMKDLGIDDGYCVQMWYPGYMGTGDMNSGFGGGNIGTYMKGGKAYDGVTEDGTRAYIECLANWYEKGWLMQDFEEHSQDLFFNLDTPSIYAGKVGLWYGLVPSQLGNAIELNDDPEVADICVYGAAQPINDVYGDASVQGKEPTCFFQDALVGNSGVVITELAADKDIATLLTAIDYFYTREGSLLRTFGFSEEEQAEYQDDFYSKWGFDNGAYELATNEDGEEVVVKHKIEGDIAGINLDMVPGLNVYKNVDDGPTELQMHGLSELKRYEAKGQVSSLLSGRLGAEESENLSGVKTQLNTFLYTAIPDFITGRVELNDDTWAEFCNEAENTYQSGLEAQYLNEMLEK